MASEHSNRGAKRAREARAELGVGSATPCECLLSTVEQLGALSVIVAAMPDDVAGACHRTGDSTLLWVNGAQPLTRQRFTLAHELAHAWCEHDGQLEVDTFETLGGRTTNPFEVTANAFAAEFLMPRAAVEAALSDRPELDQVVTVAHRYGVSSIVVVFRLKQLGLAPDAHCDALQVAIQQGLDGLIANHLGLSGPDDRLAQIDQLPYLSPALKDTHLDAALNGTAPVDARLGGAIDRLLA